MLSWHFGQSVFYYLPRMHCEGIDEVSLRCRPFWPPGVTLPFNECTGNVCDPTQRDIVFSAISCALVTLRIPVIASVSGPVMVVVFPFSQPSVSVCCHTLACNLLVPDSNICSLMPFGTQGRHVLWDCYSVQHSPNQGNLIKLREVYGSLKKY